MSKDAVRFADLSPTAREGINRAYAYHGWGETYPYLTLEQAAVMFFRLRKLPDSEEYFPKGKWATIQFLESLIDEAL